MTLAEHLHRTAPELRIFDLPREQEDSLRATIWKDIRSFNSRLGPVRQFVGLDFRNFMEFSEAILGCMPKAGDRVLDVGGLVSPLGLYLASKGCEVHVIDSDPQIRAQEQTAREAGLAHLLSQKKYVVQKMSGRSMAYENNFFDCIIALNSVDHLLEGADQESLREFARVLKPGGHCTVSVSYGRKTKESTRGRTPLRTYSELDLQQRLINPIPLALLRKFYFGEDNLGLATLWRVIPEGIRTGVFGWIVYPAAQTLGPNDVTDKRSATRVCLLYQKPD